MDFQLDEDQLALREGVRSFCDGRVPLDSLASFEETAGFDRSLWTELAELGVFNLREPESAGGVGLGTADAVLVFAELGRRVVPGPLVWSHLAAGLVKGAATGETVVGGVEADIEPVLVEHLESLDVLLALRDTGVFRIDPRELEAAAIATPLDPLTPLHHVANLPAGEKIAGPEVAQRLRLEGATLASALLLGIAEATLEMALEYSKQREQFGRPIGSFQAMKHMMADMFVKQEVARAAAYAAGATLDQPSVGDIDRAVGSAKIISSEAALRNSGACIQVHGGMGFTWEVPVHYYLKRSWVLENCFGSIDEHSERVAIALADARE
ncbi:MAG: acyl-CoA dehydrogenase [bacterium]|nr:acyl-CoA dehydrogenase [bacterium]